MALGALVGAHIVCCISAIRVRRMWRVRHYARRAPFVVRDCRFRPAGRRRELLPNQIGRRNRTRAVDSPFVEWSEVRVAEFAITIALTRLLSSATVEIVDALGLHELDGEWIAQMLCLRAHESDQHSQISSGNDPSVVRLGPLSHLVRNGDLNVKQQA